MFIPFKKCWLSLPWGGDLAVVRICRVDFKLYKKMRKILSKVILLILYKTAERVGARQNGIQPEKNLIIQLIKNIESSNIKTLVF